MKELQEQMGKQGKGSQGEGKEGGKKGGMSKKIAKLAAEQGAIREELKRLQQELEKEKSGGEGAGDLQKLMDEIEKSEKDLYNKNITPELIRRQQDILTRLLEHENAQKEREWDDKRESKEGENKKSGNPSDLLEYKRLKEREAELLQTVPVDMKPYYKRKANEYLNSLEQDDRNEK
jgi:hypothetical protein